MRTAIVTLSAALLGLAALTVAHAQEPTGSISGRIVYEGEPGPGYFEQAILVVPADTPQPIPYGQAESFFLEHDRTGAFEATGLADGEYLVGFEVNPDWAPSLREEIVLEVPTASGMWKVRHPALRVRVSGGRAVTGPLEISIRLPEEPSVAPITSLPNLPRGTGSISGHIYREGCDRCQDQRAVVVVPSDLGRPLRLAEMDDAGYTMDTDIWGSYTVTDIADGEYLVAPVALGLEFQGSFSESVANVRPNGKVDEYPAIRVRISDGEAITGVDFVIPEEEPIPVVPVAEADQGGWGSLIAYIGAGVAGLAVLLLAVGVARRLAGLRTRG